MRFYCFMLLIIQVWAKDHHKPHIILIVADDLGWNDISYHGSDQIPTPNIDALAYDGVPLQRHYAQPSCTPARAALLTGNYPIRTGMQGYPLTNSEDRGLPYHTKLLPSYLKDLGYSTHAIGKWHLGMSRSGMMPTKRGFDSHFGYHGGFVDYYEHTSEEMWGVTAVSGFDLHRNETAAWDIEGYLPDLLTDEAVKLIDTHNVTQAPLFLYMAQVLPHSGNPGAMLQPPPATVRAHRHIGNQQRRLYAGLVSKLDESVGEIVTALSRKNMLKDSIIVFLSDNGARTTGSYRNWGSNWPHRGVKMTPWEGGVKVPAFVWSPKIKKPHIWEGLMHISDWLPTLISAAKGRPPSTVDGKNQWDAMISNEESKRTEVLVDLDDYDGTAAYIIGQYKMVIGNMTGGYNDHYGSDLLLNNYSPPLYETALLSSVTAKALQTIGRTIDLEQVLKTRQMLTTNCQVKEREPCVPENGKYCLYDLSTDPCERHDLSGKKRNEASSILVRLQHYWRLRVPRVTVLRELGSHPASHNYTWTPWLCNSHMKANGDIRIETWDFLSSVPNSEI